MNKYKYTGAVCLNCGAERLYNHRQYFNAKDDSSELSELLSGNFSFLKCPKCGVLMPIYDLIYEDPINKKTIFYNMPQKLEQVFKQRPFKTDEFYTATSFEDFYNCVFSINHKLDWWVVKLFLCNSYLTFMENCRGKGFKQLEIERCVLFEKDNGIQLYISLLHEDWANIYSLTDDFYKILYEKYYKTIIKIVESNHYLSEEAAIKVLTKGE